MNINTTVRIHSINHKVNELTQIMTSSKLIVNQKKDLLIARLNDSRNETIATLETTKLINTATKKMIDAPTMNEEWWIKTINTMKKQERMSYIDYLIAFSKLVALSETIKCILNANNIMFNPKSEITVQITNINQEVNELIEIVTSGKLMKQERDSCIACLNDSKNDLIATLKTTELITTTTKEMIDVPTINEELFIKIINIMKEEETMSIIDYEIAFSKFNHLSKTIKSISNGLFSRRAQEPAQEPPQAQEPAQEPAQAQAQAQEPPQAPAQEPGKIVDDVYSSDEDIPLIAKRQRKQPMQQPLDDVYSSDEDIPLMTKHQRKQPAKIVNDLYLSDEDRPLIAKRQRKQPAQQPPEIVNDEESSDDDIPLNGKRSVAH